MKSISHREFKSPHLSLLPDEENGKCSIARYCAEFPMVRRVLGGGCGYCDEDQILFSVIASEGGGAVPTDIQGAYSRILGGLINTLKALGFDGKLEPTRNAVYSQGRKISGNAQGRFDGAVLVNGSFLLDFGFDEMDRVLKNPTMNLAEGVECARDGMITLSELLDGAGYDIDHVKGALKRGFEVVLGVEAQRGVLTDSEIELAQRLSEKHRSREWIYRMDDKRRRGRDESRSQRDLWGRLERLDISAAVTRIAVYSHQLSGGSHQKVDGVCKSLRKIIVSMMLY